MGSRISVSAVALMSPPITTMANGRWISEPGPVAKSTGISPKAVIEAVINTGRSRRCAPSITQQDSAPELPAFEVRIPLAATNERACSAALRLVPGRVRFVFSDRSGRTVERTVNVVGDTVVEVAAKLPR